MSWAFSWLMGTRVGRFITLGAVVFAAIALALVKAFMAGQAREKMKQAQASLDALRQRMRTDDEIARLDPDARRRRLREWVRR